MRRSALLFASLLGYQLVAQPIPEPIPGLPTITASLVTASLEANEGIVAWSARGDFLGISGQSGHENPFPLLVNVGEPLPLYLVDFGLPQNDMPDNLVIVDGKEYSVRTVGLGFVMPTTASGPIVPLVPATNPPTLFPGATLIVPARVEAEFAAVCGISFPAAECTPGTPIANIMIDLPGIVSVDLIPCNCFPTPGAPAEDAIGTVSFTSTPEPSSVALAIIGVLGAGALRLLTGRHGLCDEMESDKGPRERSRGC